MAQRNVRGQHLTLQTRSLQYLPTSLIHRLGTSRTTDIRAKASCSQNWRLAASEDVVVALLCLILQTLLTVETEEVTPETTTATVTGSEYQKGAASVQERGDTPGQDQCHTLPNHLPARDVENILLAQTEANGAGIPLEVQLTVEGTELDSAKSVVDERGVPRRAETGAKSPGTGSP